MNFKFDTSLEILAREIRPLTDYRIINGIELSGVYAVWWTGSIQLLKTLSRDVHIQGKRITVEERKENELTGTFHVHQRKWDWNLETIPVCLYVGKANNIGKRIKQHLEERIPSDKWYAQFSIRRRGEWLQKVPCIDEHFLVKRTSACQIRAGIEHLFKNQKPNTIQQKLENFGISVCQEPDFSNRFYLEDLAIGYFRPWFNLDSER